MISDGIKLLRAGGVYVLVGMVHPDSKLDINGDEIIHKCITIKGKDVSFRLFCKVANLTVSLTRNTGATGCRTLSMRVYYLYKYKTVFVV